MFPDWAVLDPALLATLPAGPRAAALVDGIGQCVESAWAPSASPASRDYALEGLGLILAHGGDYLEEPASPAAGAVLMGAHLGGKAINLTKTTAAHALSYGLTTRHGIAHGFAVGLCLADVWRHYAASAEPGSALADAIDALARAFGADAPADAPDRFEARLADWGVRLPRPAAAAGDVEALTAGVDPERLGNSPVPLPGHTIAGIYRRATSAVG
jgi:alcohol dehydrogenase class IV